ncbi:predicted protein [Naegleria gruberi]|uniref:Predicted protein n=1 Tax=Naegleria gruberi TaxID=5762 RepID=D2VEC1_NAEGR|nr:uncharacterized protein NAEGRDRAFT_79637 [Naegleria gruberi]EFC44771.1 predicted protein [Naegleria gruberi]|eukprot:XP_002677515.1 predicted protein [Naegleria gruberi strain NEG-M]
MARTRQTARAFHNSRPEEPCFTNDVQQTELFSKLLRENCQALRSDDDKSLHSRLAQYKNCTKLAQLWMLEDMMKSENDHDQSINDVEYLKQLPEELKIEIVSFIPTYSRYPSVSTILECYSVGGGELASVPEVEYLDVCCYGKLVIQTLSNNGLDITGFVMKCFLSIDRRIWFVYSLLESHNRFIQGEWDGKFNLVEYPFSHPQNDYDYATQFGGSFTFGNNENNSTKFESTNNNLDLSSIDFNSIKSIEEELITKNEFSLETPFDITCQSKEKQVVDLVAKQSVRIAQVYNQFSHTNMSARSDFSNNCINGSIKTLAISLSSTTFVSGILDLLPNIEHLTIILYDSLELYHSLANLRLTSRTNLQSVNVIALKNLIWSDFAGFFPPKITTFYTFLQDGPLNQYHGLEMYLDGKLMQNEFTQQIATDPSLITPKLFFKSCDFKFFKEIAHKYTLFPFISGISFFFRVSKFTSLEEQKSFTNFIAKNYPLEGFQVDDYIFQSLIKHIPTQSLLVKTSNISVSNTFFHTLHIAMKNPQLSNDTILKLIEKEPALVLQVDNENLTPLHYACSGSSNRWPLIPHLEKIAGPNCWFALDSNQNSPLDYVKLVTGSFSHLFPYGPSQLL